MSDFPSRRRRGRISSGGGGGVYVFALIVAILFVIVEQLIAINIPDSRAITAAEDLGFSDVTVTDSSTIFIQFKGCSKSDVKLFNIEATNQAGQKRTFIVCAGIFKGATVRSI